MEIQNDYQQYAFLDTPSEASVESSAFISEDRHTQDITKWFTIKAYMSEIIKRTYDLPNKWYFVVFAPFNKAYAKDVDWFMHESLKATRRYFKRPKVIIGTKEIKSAKIHINWLVCTDQVLKDGSNTSRHRLDVSVLNDIGDRRRVLDYILKESSERKFEQYKDYVYAPK